MKKPQPVRLPKISADTVAQNLKRGLGKDKAFKVADGLAHNLTKMGADDYNHDFFKPKEVQKNERFWTQVRNILAK